MSQTTQSAVAVIGIDIGKNSFHIVGHDERGAIVLRQKWSRGQVETRLSNIDPVHPPVDAELSLLAEAQRTLTCALSGGAPASCSRSTAMICSSVNLIRFIAPRSPKYDCRREDNCIE